MNTNKKIMKYFYVYIVRCNDGSYYTGHTDNLEKRLSEHQMGIVPCYTSTRLPITLVFMETFESREQAIASEIKIKKWSRKKKEALIAKDWIGLQRLASRSKKSKG